MPSFYLIPMLLGALISLYAASTLRVRKKTIVMDKPFNNEFSNELHTLSFGTPFSWFVEPDANHPKVKQINQLIAEANLSHQLDYRVFMVIQLTFTLLCLTLSLGFLLFFEQTNFLFKILFNISFAVEGADSTMQTKLVIVGIFMLFALFPKLWIKKKAKKNKFNFVRDLPVLQLFILQTLRANNTTGEVLYLMSKIETRYQNIFAVGYRIYSRDSKEGFEYLKGSFSGTKFEETLSVLEDFHQFSREESFKVLLNISRDIDDQLANLKKSKATGSMLLAEGSILLPLASTLFLLFIPIIVFATSMMAQAQDI